ncbi:class I SAM-dependent methyltransferase [Nocardioides bruguierae]|uniref:class I SAM-dependent methyltransferase n=1 Tax=Nocardioides bruguierae TaxID=2945102 RepID=UPI0020203176|nr:class I SAM-dependent methyltransferase [Nocardioides bruguierae]MCL8025995.1 class I SAM-dependent methyltransferase [Nocardioides bruguierae]
MGWWTDRVVPHVVHAALDNPGLEQLRRETTEGLHGEVLEIGFGSGLNLPHLPDAVTAVHAVDPSDVGWRMSEQARGASRVPVDRVGLDGAGRIDAEDRSFDDVLITFTLCTVPDRDAVLSEVRRLLRPGGALHLLEHGRDPRPVAARAQDVLNPVQKALVGGCHTNRVVLEPFESPGWVLQSSAADHVGPRVMLPLLNHLTRAVAVPVAVAAA